MIAPYTKALLTTHLSLQQCLTAARMTADLDISGLATLAEEVEIKISARIEAIINVLKATDAFENEHDFNDTVHMIVHLDDYTETVHRVKGLEAVINACSQIDAIDTGADVE